MQSRQREHAIDLETLQVTLSRGRVAGMTSSNEPATRVVEIQRLSLVFETADGPVHALSEVELAIEAGEFVSFERTTVFGCCAT